MAYSKYLLSLAVAGFVLAAATSGGSSQTQPPSFIQIAGQLFCNDPPGPEVASGVEVMLLCGTTLTRPSKTDDLGAFGFLITDDEAAVFGENPGNCGVYVTKPVAGCVYFEPGEALKAKLIPLSFFRGSYITQGFETVVWFYE